MSEFEITREVHGPGGRYVAQTASGEAVLSYRIIGAARISADHTFVPPEERSRGYAAELVRRLVEDARAEGVRIVPACSYVDAERKRHPAWASVFDA